MLIVSLAPSLLVAASCLLLIPKSIALTSFLWMATEPPPHTPLTPTHKNIHTHTYTLKPSHNTSMSRDPVCCLLRVLFARGRETVKVQRSSAPDCVDGSLQRKVSVFCTISSFSSNILFLLIYSALVTTRLSNRSSEFKIPSTLAS